MSWVMTLSIQNKKFENMSHKSNYNIYIYIYIYIYAIAECLMFKVFFIIGDGGTWVCQTYLKIILLYL